MFATLEKALFEGYATRDLDITTMFICIGFTAVLSLYICFLYKMMNRNSFYERSFMLSLFCLSVVTAAIILTIQSNIVVSLGMVGALSIVRFRTAIKSPMDLVFLFWSISVGIICGAGFAMIALIATIVLTIGILVFSALPSEREAMILIVNLNQYAEEVAVGVVKNTCRSWKIRSRSISRDMVSLAIEVRTDHPITLMRKITSLENVTSASLVDHDGDVTA